MSTSEGQQHLSRTDNASTHPYNSSYLNRQQNKQDFPTGSAGTDTAKSLGRYEKRTTFLSKQEEYSLIFLVSRGEGFSRLTGGDVVSCSRLWPACLPPADAWPPAGHAAPGGSCGRWMPGGSRLEEERKRNLTFRCSLNTNK